MKVKRITLTVEPSDGAWGFSDMLGDMGQTATDDERIDAVISLCNEDIVALLDGAVWEVEFD